MIRIKFDSTPFKKELSMIQMIFNSYFVTYYINISYS